MGKDIKIGDILIFEAENDWISKSIAILTNSDVSHAALVHDNMTLAEMGLSGIQSNKFHIDEAGRKVYQLRLNPQKDPTPIARAAEAYINAKVPYDKPSLYILAGLLIYRRIRRPTARWRKVTDLIINAACLTLDKLINKHVHGPDTKVMVCSQLVYQCYWDCGKDYKIEINGGLLQDTASNGIRLADIVENNDFDHFSNSLETSEMNLDNINSDNLAKELYEALSDDNNDDELLVENDLIGTAHKAQQFMDLLEKLMNRLSIKMPLDALFVTPADLLRKADNLTQISTFKMERDK